MKRIIIGSDHGGFLLKEELKSRLEKEGYEVFDAGCYSTDMVDYPIVATELCNKLLNDNYDSGILICGTGIGVSIAANKVKGIRAALCSDCFSARMAKEHNDANVITLGARTIGVELAWEIVKSYLKASFTHGVHEPRVEMLNAIIK